MNTRRPNATTPSREEHEPTGVEQREDGRQGQAAGPDQRGGALVHEGQTRLGVDERRVARIVLGVKRVDDCRRVERLVRRAVAVAGRS